MTKAARHFLTDDAGAVTVDWVVLTASLIGIGMLVMMPVVFSVDSASSSVASYVTNTTVGYTP